MRLLDDQLTKRRHDVNVEINGYEHRLKGQTTNLSIGLGVGNPHDGVRSDTILFGPELEFGNVVGNHIKKKVLLLKYAVGGDVAPTSQQLVPSTLGVSHGVPRAHLTYTARPQVRPYTRPGGHLAQRIIARRGREFAARTAAANSACLMTRKTSRLRIRPMNAATSVVRHVTTQNAAMRTLSRASAIIISCRPRVATQAP